MRLVSKIWEMMAAFAGYSFPKAHAASYAQLAWNSAWCKSHYPAEFMTAVLSFGRVTILKEFISWNPSIRLSVLPPHINASDRLFRVLYPEGKPKIYMGLSQVKDLTQKTTKKILENRPFSSLEDFLVKVDPQTKEIQNLLMVGAFSGLTTIPEGLSHIKQQHPPGQMQLFPSEEVSEDWSQDAIANSQTEILGVSLSITPLEKIADQIEAIGAISTLEAQNYIGEKVKIVGMRQTWRRFKTQSNNIMCYLNIEDLEGSLQVIIPSQLYRRTREILVENGPFLVEGSLSMMRIATGLRCKPHKFLLSTQQTLSHK